jgi:uncharacterized protein YndB with AHSA1/START domain
MTPQPTGRVVATGSGVDLVLDRRIRGSVTDVWASITESERTARWFGQWEGDARAGATIRVQMGFEEGGPWSEVLIESCTPPTHLALIMGGDWHLELTLHAEADHTRLTFIQHRPDSAGVGEIGPGWEYYLDNLLASREGSALPAFDDYYPSQQQHYEAAARAL